MIGQPIYQIIYPCLEHAVSLSSAASILSQLPEKSASTKTSRPALILGLNIMPFVLVPLRYLPIHFTAFPCSVLGAIVYLAH